MNNGKTAKTPPLSSKTKLLSFDLEANGLHGPVFAAGAVVMDGLGKVYAEFSARCEIAEEVDPWVKENVLSVIADMPITHNNYQAIRKAFWNWYLKTEAESDYVLVSNGYPVEYRFLIQCQEDDLASRYWQHPFPILDLASLLVQVGPVSAAIRNQLVAQFFEAGDYTPHHPLHDAKMSALVAFEAFKLSGQLK